MIDSLITSFTSSFCQGTSEDDDAKKEKLLCINFNVNDHLSLSNSAPAPISDSIIDKSIKFLNDSQKLMASKVDSYKALFNQRAPRTDKISPEELRSQQELSSLISQYLEENKKRKNFVDKYEEYINTFDVSNFHEIILFVLKLCMDEEKFELAKINLSDKKDFVKTLKDLAFIPLNLIQFYYLYKQSRACKEMIELMDTGYKDLRISSDPFSQKLVAQIKALEETNKKEIKKAWQKFGWQEGQFIVIKTLDILFFFTISKISKLLFKFFKNLSKLKKLYDANSIRRTWEENHRIKPIQINETSIPNDNIDNNLLKEAEEFNAKVNSAIQFILSTTDVDCLQDLFPILEEKKFLITQEIRALSSIEEWKEKISNPNFVHNICKDHVNHHITVGKLLSTGTQNLVVEKIKIEKMFLIFKAIKCVTNAFLNISHVFALIPNLLTLVGSRAQHVLLTSLGTLDDDISLPGIDWFCLLNPKFDVSVFGVIQSCITYILGHHYKPNEFSLKGYLISTEIKTRDFFYYSQLLVLRIARLFFMLVNKLVITFSKYSFETSYKYLDDTIINLQQSHKEKIKNLNREMTCLKKLDIKKSLNPALKSHLTQYGTLQKYLKENRCPAHLLKKINHQLKENGALEAELEQEIDEFLAANFLYRREAILKLEVNLKYNYDQIEIITNGLVESVTTTNEYEKLLFLDKSINFFKDINLDVERVPLLDNNQKDADSLKVTLPLQIETFFTASLNSFFKLLA